MVRTLVIALGGNALIKPGQKGTAEQQIANLEQVAEQVASLYNRGWRIVITHGNGPQVGRILLRQEKAKDYAPQLPLYVCVAESQGMIGYYIQEAFTNFLRRKGLRIPVVTVVTQVLVDPQDPAFRKPEKPIGPYYQTRKGLSRKWTLVNTIKGFRRVVASPRPKEIVEAREIKKISREAMVIACGGGGIPVIKKRGLVGVDAVIDKDYSAAKLGKVVGAHTLAILTDVDFVYLNYRKSNQKKLTHATLEQLKDYQSHGHFAPGSMGPKIQAAAQFLRSGGKRVVITHIDCLEKAMDGEWGTHIKR